MLNHNYVSLLIHQKKRQKLNENNNSTNHKPEKITLPAEILKFNAESNTYSVQLTNNSLGAKTSHTIQTTVDIDAKFINSMLYRNRFITSGNIDAKFIVIDEVEDDDIEDKEFDWDELAGYVQTKSSNELDKYLNNIKRTKINITKNRALGITQTALCGYTIRDYKAIINESPLKTICVMEKWNILCFNDDNILQIGRDLLYTGLHNQKKNVNEFTFEVIEYILCHVESIQFFDSRNVNMVMCFHDADYDDWHINETVKEVNNMRADKKKGMVSLMQDNTEIIPNSIIDIIAEYCFASYNFHYDPMDYTLCGFYKQI
eukprot:185388_1